MVTQEYLCRCIVTPCPLIRWRMLSRPSSHKTFNGVEMILLYILDVCSKDKWYLSSYNEGSIQPIKYNRFQYKQYDVIALPPWSPSFIPFVSLLFFFRGSLSRVLAGKLIDADSRLSPLPPPLATTAPSTLLHHSLFRPPSVKFKKTFRSTKVFPFHFEILVWSHKRYCGPDGSRVSLPIRR